MRRPPKNGNGKEYELVYPAKETGKKIVASIEPAQLEKIKSFGNTLSGSNLLVRGENLSALMTLIKMKEKGLLKNADGTHGIRVIYIDPPFATNLAFKGRKNQKAYEDKIVGAEFVEFLRKRLVLLKELLTDDGSIFVHLDWKKAHYVKVIMDEVFGEENFLNDIVWSYGGRGAKAKAGQFSRNHDIILWYQKKTHIFNQIFTQKRIKKGAAGFREDSEGRWFKTSPRGDYTDSSIAALKKEGRIYLTKNGSIRIKYFLKEDGDCLIEDKLIGDVWDDIPDAMHISEDEKTGYPTQKPEALLVRIIKAASNKGDIILDAFAGAGTTLVAAEKLGRAWIGIDSGGLSVHTIETRLLGLNDTKDPENPKKRYLKPLRPFSVFESVEGCCEKDSGIKVRSRYLIDEKTNDCVIKIEGFKSAGASGHEALSSVMVDFNFDGDVFNLHKFYSAKELRETGYQIRFPLSMVKGEVMVIYSDIHGNERWYLGEIV